MFQLTGIKRLVRIYSSHSAFILMLVPIFLIISSSVHPAIISGIQNKEIAITANVLAQLQEDNSKKYTSNFHTTVPTSQVSTPLWSPTPTTATSPSSSYTAPTTHSHSNKDFTSQATLGSLSARPTNNIVNTNSFYDVVFLTASAGTIKKIEVTFPAGTTIPSSAFFNEAEGIGPGTASKSGQTITYIVTNGVNVHSGTKIRLEFSNINNPINPSSNLKVTVTTRDAANMVIDGPTQSTAYTMKQIGTNAIANNAVTTPKIADDAVTAAKIKEDLVHTVYQDFSLGNNEVFYERDGGGFDPYTTNLSNSPAESQLPSIAASGNNVYVVWYESTGFSNDIMYSRSIEGGGIPNTIFINLSNNGGNSIDPSIAASGNSVYVVWVDNDLGTDEIFYRRSTDGGTSFEPTVNLSNTPGGSLAPSITVSGNNVHVVWVDNSLGTSEVFYKRSTDGGTSFGSSINLSNTAGASTNPSIAISGSNIFVVWQDDTVGPSEIFYRRSTDGGVNFGSTVNLSNNPGVSRFPSIATSGANVHVTWFDDTPGNDEIFYRRSTDGGVNFGSTINLSNEPFDSFLPSVAVSGNSVHVIWYLDGRGDVIYKRSTDGGATFESHSSTLTERGFNPSIAVS